MLGVFKKLTVKSIQINNWSSPRFFIPIMLISSSSSSSSFFCFHSNGVNRNHCRRNVNQRICKWGSKPASLSSSSHNSSRHRRCQLQTPKTAPTFPRKCIAQAPPFLGPHCYACCDLHISAAAFMFQFSAMPLVRFS